MMDFGLRAQDLEVTNGDLVLCLTDSHAIAQAISIRLKTLSGEWFLDTQIGLPYFTHILGQHFSERFLRQLILREMAALPGVVDVTDFVVEPGKAARTISIRFNAILSNQTSIAINESIGV